MFRHKLKSVTKMIRAVGFDLDDTILFTNRLKSKSLKLFLSRKFGLSSGQVKACMKIFEVGDSVPRRERFGMIFSKIHGREPGKRELDSFQEMLLHAIHEAICSEAKQVGGIRKILEFLSSHWKTSNGKGSKVILFVVSNRSEHDIWLYLKAHGLSQFFDFAIGLEASKKFRAKEEAFDLVVKKFSLSKDELLYFGDAVSDVTACKKIGVKVIGVNRSGKKRKVLLEAGAEKVIKDFRQLDLGKKAGSLELSAYF